MKITIEVDDRSLRRWEQQLDILAELYRDAAGEASVAAAEAIQLETRSLLSIFPHPAFTQTNSPAGLPPGFITGELMDSVVVDPHPGELYAEVGPTTDYGREQELGGPMEGHPYMSWIEDGRRHYSKAHSLPGRPYLKPATENVIDRGEVTNIYYEHFASAQAKATS